MVEFSIFANTPVESEGSPKLLNLCPQWPVSNAFQWGMLKIKIPDQKVFFDMDIGICRKSLFVEVF